MKETIALMNSMRQRLGWDKTDTLESLIGYLNEEVKELSDEILCESIDLEKVESELADVLIVVLGLLDDLKLDAHSIVKKKMKQVIIKYEQT
jgi:NTP pyrophosphatase (non-canonical NTP hydrolase)